MRTVIESIQVRDGAVPALILPRNTFDALGSPHAVVIDNRKRAALQQHL